MLLPFFLSSLLSFWSDPQDSGSLPLDVEAQFSSGGAPCSPEEAAHVLGVALDQVDTSSFSGPWRAVAPGAMVTEDHVPTRKNLHTDDRGVIYAITCG